MIAVFCRANPPESQGSHSYSVLFVRCLSGQVGELERRLAFGPGLPEPLGHAYHGGGGDGGNFDLVATIPVDELETVGPYYNPAMDAGLPPVRASVGDHRFIGFFEAEDVLGRYNAANLSSSVDGTAEGAETEALPPSRTAA